MRFFLLCKPELGAAQESTVHGGECVMKQQSRAKYALGETDGAPLYASVKQMILDKIHSGEWPPRHRVPSENELVSALGVSKMTANRALRELANDGELIRIQGAGSFVADRKGSSALLEVRNIAEEIAERGHVHAAVVVALKTASATPDIASALDLEIGAPVFHSLIVHSEDDVPIQIEDRYVNPAAAPDYLAQDFTALTPNAYLTTAAPLSGSSHVVEAIMPQPWERKLLLLLDGEPCLAIRRRTWSLNRVVSVARLIYPGFRYRLEAQSGRGFGTET